MNLIHYIARQTYRGAKNWVRPGRLNCWLRCQTHDWNGKKPEPGWSSKQCDDCAHTVRGCGM